MSCGCKKKPVVTPTVQTENNKTPQNLTQQDKLINEIINKVKELSK